MNDELKVTVTEDGVVLDGPITDDPDIIAQVMDNSPSGDYSEGLSKLLNAGAKEITRLYEMFPEAQADGTDPKALFEISRFFGEKAPEVYTMIKERLGKVALDDVQAMILEISRKEKDRVRVTDKRERGFLWRR